MSWALAADLVLVLHLAFVVLVVAGGLIVWCRPRFAWLHLPALAWGVWIEFSHGICPLTPLENELRRRAGEGGYSGDFIGHYLTRLLYPEGLAPEHQWLLGGLVLLLNLAIYAGLWRRLRHAHPKQG